MERDMCGAVVGPYVSGHTKAVHAEYYWINCKCNEAFVLCSCPPPSLLPLSSRPASSITCQPLLPALCRCVRAVARAPRRVGVLVVMDDEATKIAEQPPHKKRVRVAWGWPTKAVD